MTTDGGHQLSPAPGRTNTRALPAPAADPPATGRARAGTLTVLAGLLALHLVVTFQVRPSPRWNDALFVLNNARDYPDVPLDQHALRIGNLLPARLFLEIFGYGQVAFYAWPFLTGIFLLVATYSLGVVLFGRATAAGATFLLVLHPVLVSTEIRFGIERMASWQLLPDIPSAAFLTAGFALLIFALQRPAGSPRCIMWCVLLAGFCFGWAYLVRELSVFVFPVIIGVLVAWRAPLRRWVQVALPMMACLALELALSAWVYGDPLARLHVGAEHGSPPLDDLSRTDALLRLPRIVGVYPQTLAVLATLVLMVAGAVLVRRRGNVLMLAWFLSVWLPLTLVSGLLDPGFIRINASLMRYWIPVLPAVCLGAAAAVAAALGSLGHTGPAALRAVGKPVALVLTGLLMLAWAVPLIDRIARNPRDAAWNDLRSYLRENDDAVDTVMADDRNALVLAVYRFEALGGAPAWQARISKLPHALPSSPPAPAAAGTALLWTPQLSRRPPTGDAGWRLVFQRPQLRLYLDQTSR